MANASTPKLEFNLRIIQFIDRKLVTLFQSGNISARWSKTSDIVRQIAPAQVKKTNNFIRRKMFCINRSMDIFLIYHMGAIRLYVCI